MIDRKFLIQYLIDKYRFSKYLEIGTQRGYSFFPIKCKSKIAIDPLFKINKKNKIKWLVKNLYNLNNSYKEMTSDEFFQNEIDENLKLDIVLVDGLHTFEATLRDILNSIKYLSNQGIIICHDCYPPHSAAAIPARNSDDARINGSKLSGWNGEWCGDTWKAIAYLIRKYPGCMDVNVLDCDYGLGIIRNIRTDHRDLKIDDKIFIEIDKLSYEDLLKDLEGIIGLKPFNYYKEI